MRRLIVGITGASGVVYGERLLLAAAELGIETHLVLTRSAALTIAYELERPVDHGRGLRLVRRLSVEGGHAHAAEADGRNLRARTAQLARLHLRPALHRQTLVALFCFLLCGRRVCVRDEADSVCNRRFRRESVQTFRLRVRVSRALGLCRTTMLEADCPDYGPDQREERGLTE